MVSELHPLGFFLPEHTKLLMLGSFPPPMPRWSMNFYYPNIQNDMWRILGLLFYSNKEYFLESKKAFSEEKAKKFCLEKGIGIGDTAMEIIRLKNNASDNFLQVIKPIDPEEVLSQIPECKAIVVTGRKQWIPSYRVLPPTEEPKVGATRLSPYWTGHSVVPDAILFTCLPQTVGRESCSLPGYV